MREGKKFIGIVVFGLVGFLISACAPKTLVAPPLTERPAKVKKSAGTAGWEVEWEQVQAKARKEGRLVLYTGLGAEVRKIFMNALNKYGLDLEYLSGRGEELTEKMIREKRAGIYNVDLYISGNTTIVKRMKPAGLLASLEPLLILPEVKDPKIWYKGELPFSDEDRKTINFAAYPTGEIHINTDIIKPGDMKSTEDLLGPRWKGKIIMDDPTVAGRGNQWMAVFTIKRGEDYVKQLVRLNPILSRDKRQQIDWVAKERTPVGIGVYPDRFREYRDAGAPVAEIPLEIAYLSAGYGYVIYIDGAPHPNAARVFLNWLLSREGQISYEDVMEAQSSRIDTPTERLVKRGIAVRKPGMDYVDTTEEKWVLELKPRAEEIFIELFKPLVK